jgi:predicted permease
MASLFEAMLEEELKRGTLRGLVACWSRVARELASLPAGVAGVTPTRRAPARRESWIAAAAGDVGHGLRSVRREPRFAALVVLVPAVGIAMTVAVFAVVNAYLLRPLPYPEPDRLVSVTGASAAGISWDEVDAAFELGVSWDLDVFSMAGGGEPQLVPGAWVTPTFLEAYGVRPALGRAFLPGEGVPGSAPVAMISDRLWRERFGSDPGIVGRTFTAYVSDRPESAETFTVVGVLRSDFWYFHEYTDVLAPIVEPRTVYSGRLREGVSTLRARALLTEMAGKGTTGLADDFAIDVVRSRDLHVAAVRPPLLVIQGAVLLVLLIACANTAVLLLVRAAGRERELGVRRALGAPTGRLARQLVTEGLLLAGLAGIGGLVLGAFGLDVVAGMIEAQIGRTVPGGPGALRIDGRVVLAAAALCGAIGILFGLVPLLTSGRGPLSAVLGELARGGTDSRRRQRMRGVMVVAEVALSLALLTGAGLMVRSAVHLHGEDLGFRPDRVIKGEVGLRQATYPEPADRVAFFDRLIDRVRVLPQIESAALVSVLPFTSRFGTRPVAAEPDRGGTARRTESVGFIVGEGAFETLGVELVRGRDFSRADVAGAEPVAIVSESLVARLWPGENPLGRRLRTLPQPVAGPEPEEPGPWLRVVGVAKDVRRDVAGPPPGDLYTPLRQSGRLWMNVVARVRPGATTATVLPAIEDEVQRLDPVVPLSASLALDDAVREAMAPTRFLATLLAGFSAFALLLALVGLYGVIAYAARQRRRDVAIRMALGAGRAEVALLFVRQGLGVVVSGLVLGTAGGYAIGNGLAGQLHGVAPGDPATHAVLALLLLLTAAAAIWLPARQASAAEPMGVLREE